MSIFDTAIRYTVNKIPGNEYFGDDGSRLYGEGVISPRVPGIDFVPRGLYCRNPTGASVP